MDDSELLREYVAHQSEKAFAELVARHLGLVYSTALRLVREAPLAEDVSQAVFLQLARKAPAIRQGNALPGWLYRVTHCQAANAVRAERLRRERETTAMNMMNDQTPPSTAWDSIAPHLEEAMRALSHDDQNAILQRYFQDRSWREVAATLDLSEDAAQKRVSRALDKLRRHLARRGIAASASLIALAIASNAVQAAPPALVSVVTNTSLAGAAGGGISTLTLTTLKALLMKKSILIAAAVLVLITAATIPVYVSHTKKARLQGPVTAESLRVGLALDLPFDKPPAPSGAIADKGASGNHVRVSGASWTPNGKNGGAYEFTEDGNEIVVSNHPSLNSGQITLAAWIKTSFTDDKWRRIFDKSYTKGYALSIAGDWQKNSWRGLVSLEMGPGNHFLVSKTKVTDGQWHQVVTTFDGTSELIYVDGRPESRLQWPKPGQVGATDFNLVIGCNRSNLTEDDLGSSFRGLIAEPMIWNRALSTDEVAFLYQSQNGAPAPQPAAD
jgi:RNA polymerase sigma factor (sigma-70 family)